MGKDEIPKGKNPHVMTENETNPSSFKATNENYPTGLPAEKEYDEVTIEDGKKILEFYLRWLGLSEKVLSTETVGTTVFFDYPIGNLYVQLHRLVKEKSPDVDKITNLLRLLKKEIEKTTIQDSQKVETGVDTAEAKELLGDLGRKYNSLPIQHGTRDIVSESVLAEAYNTNSNYWLYGITKCITDVKKYLNEIISLSDDDILVLYKRLGEDIDKNS